MKSLLLALLVAMLTGCTTPPYEQKIEGSLVKGGTPAANVKVRFLSDYSGDSCEAPGLEATTDKSGKFSFNQIYTPSMIERYVVQIHPYRLCISTDGKWKTVWRHTTGPAPRSISFLCELGDKGDMALKVTLDGYEVK